MSVKKQILDHIQDNFSDTFSLQQEYRSHSGYSKLEVKNFLS